MQWHSQWNDTQKVIKYKLSKNQNLNGLVGGGGAVTELGFGHITTNIWACSGRAVCHTEQSKICW